MNDITEETARKLNEQMEKLNNCTGMDTQAVNDFVDIMINNICMDIMKQSIDKCYHYAEKLTNASFLTRWYYNRKFEKSLSFLEETMQFVKSLKEIE